jgi:hypothetical protein
MGKWHGAFSSTVAASRAGSRNRTTSFALRALPAVSPAVSANTRAEVEHEASLPQAQTPVPLDAHHSTALRSPHEYAPRRRAHPGRLVFDMPAERGRY